VIPGTGNSPGLQGGFKVVSWVIFVFRYQREIHPRLIPIGAQASAPGRQLMNVSDESR
jgi:hypothetical protein